MKATAWKTDVDCVPVWVPGIGKWLVRPLLIEMRWGSILSWLFFFSLVSRGLPLWLRGPSSFFPYSNDVRIFRLQVSIYLSQLQPKKDNLLKDTEASPKPVAGVR